MNALSFTGITIITFALVSYSIAIKSENKNRRIIPCVLIFITLGVVLDVTATIFLILGSWNSSISFPGFVALTALMLMLIAFVRVWQAYKKTGRRGYVTKGLHLYTQFAYLCWVVAYFLSSLHIAS